VGSLRQRLVPSHEGDVSPYTTEFIFRAAAGAAAVSPEAGVIASARLFQSLSHSLRICDALLVPTMATIGYRAGDDYTTNPLEVAGIPLDHFVEAALTPALNACSRCPALSIPIGVASNGVPIGVQVSTGPFEDDVAIRVAAALQVTRPWTEVAPPPRLPDEED
jgi:Asp-tRNA(Asn)/Glu-tRNA(Gln) amidotransferase A subunit family amidase